MSTQLKRITFSTCNSNPTTFRKDSGDKQDLLGSNPRKRRITAITPDLYISSCTCTHDPLKHIKLQLETRGIKRNIVSANTVKKFFTDPTEDDYSSYQEDVLKALRSRNIDKLRVLIKSGRSLQCCNRFGESLMHMACRRSFDDVVKFLITEAGVSVRVKDDLWRTPLHDAFWTAEPNKNLIKILLNEEPSLLFISDKRGHTPLDYCRKIDWQMWNEFLSEICDGICQKLKDY